MYTYSFNYNKLVYSYIKIILPRHYDHITDIILSKELYSEIFLAAFSLIATLYPIKSMWAFRPIYALLINCHDKWTFTPRPRFICRCTCHNCITTTTTKVKYRSIMFDIFARSHRSHTLSYFYSYVQHCWEMARIWEDAKMVKLQLLTTPLSRTSRSTRTSRFRTTP